MSASQRRKGAVGERELAEKMASIGIKAQRNARNGVNQAEDILHSLIGVHVECKRVERLNLHDAMKQAEIAAGCKVPTVWHRRNRGPWLVTLRAGDIALFLASFEQATK